MFVQYLDGVSLSVNHISFLAAESGNLLLLPAFLLKWRHVSKMKVAVYEKLFTDIL